MSTEYYLPYSKETYENFNLLIWILVNQRIFWFLIVQTHSVDYVTAAVFFYMLNQFLNSNKGSQLYYNYAES